MQELDRFMRGKIMKFTIKLTLLVTLSTLILFGLGGCEQILSPGMPSINHLDYNPGNHVVEISYTNDYDTPITSFEVRAWTKDANGKKIYGQVSRLSLVTDYSRWQYIPSDGPQNLIYFYVTISNTSGYYNDRIFKVNGQ